MKTPLTIPGLLLNGFKRKGYVYKHPEAPSILGWQSDSTGTVYVQIKREYSISYHTVEDFCLMFYVVTGKNFDWKY